jgi:hypothetical protein
MKSNRAMNAANASREIDWYSVWCFVRPLLRRTCPYPGAPEWCSLPDADPRKCAAVLLAGALWSLNESARQDSERQAHAAIRESADWTAVARRRRGRGPAYVPRERADR